MAWQDCPLDDRTDHIITRSHPSRHVRDQRSAWRHWPWVTITAIAVWLGYAVAVKAIPQAVLDCLEYCEQPIE